VLIGRGLVGDGSLVWTDVFVLVEGIGRFDENCFGGDAILISLIVGFSSSFCSISNLRGLAFGVAVVGIQSCGD